MRTRNEEKEYLLRPEGYCYVGKKMQNGIEAVVVRYSLREAFHCEYNGEPVGDEIFTDDVEEALDWLYERAPIMTYADFKKKVRNLIEKAGGKISVGFRYDKEKGKYFANCADGVTIIGNPGTLKISVRWGNHHAGIAKLEEF